MTLAAVLATVSLAFAAGMSYMIRAKLNAATDAAGLAAARAVSVGGDQAAQIASAKAAASRFFYANFPTNYLMSTATLNDTQVTFDSKGEVTINVSASATMPMTLLGGLPSGGMSPGDMTQTKRKQLDMVLVLDTSGSLSGSAASVRSAAKTFLSQFNSSQDRVGLLHFAYGAVLDDAIRPIDRGFNRDSMNTHIAALNFAGSTASVEGMWLARQQMNSIPAANNNRSNVRVIVFFSDGSPNSFGTYLTWNTTSDCQVAGTISTDDDGSGDPGGLYRLDATNTSLGGGCTPNSLKSKASKLPDFYNGHNPANNQNDPTAERIPVITNTPRVVANTLTYDNVNRAARNLAEAMASKARDEGTVVFTLGLGSQLKTITGTDTEKGEDVLKCMANSPDAPARCLNTAKPVGMYCYAATASDLTPCFSKLASAMLRISK
ncbi:vWA domain-containing protein [Duganella margarita]|uniref:vWA domain-containing protein n=1 Tax=Duganella margarita TaxID=2692170 RepID=UPI001371893C